MHLAIAISGEKILSLRNDLHLALGVRGPIGAIRAHGPRGEKIPLGLPTGARVRAPCARPTMATNRWTSATSAAERATSEPRRLRHFRNNAVDSPESGNKLCTAPVAGADGRRWMLIVVRTRIGGAGGGS